MLLLKLMSRPDQHQMHTEKRHWPLSILRHFWAKEYIFLLAFFQSVFIHIGR